MANNNGGKTANDGSPSVVHERSECFVIMPISDPAGYEAGHFSRVYEDLFIPACEAAGYRAVRADQIKQTNLIHLDVLQKIIDSPMALCDLSSRNPNVLFELGIRQAFDKPVVLVQEIGTEAIFDINPLRYTEYHKEMLYRQVIEDQQKITNALTATTEDIGNAKSVNSIVKLLSLIHPASLANIPEGDRNTELLQVIMTEIGNLKSELKTVRPRANKDRPLRHTKTQTERLVDVFVEGGTSEAEQFAKAIHMKDWSSNPPIVFSDHNGSGLTFEPNFPFSDDELKTFAKLFQVNISKIYRYDDKY